MTGLVVFLVSVNAGLLLTVALNAVRARRRKLERQRKAGTPVVWFVKYIPLDVSETFIAPAWGGATGPAVSRDDYPRNGAA